MTFFQHFREGLIRSCWTVDHTKRPTAPEIVDFLATNIRVVCPCLDVPLASVQLENTSEMDFQLPESLRKFSMSLSWPLQQQHQPNVLPLAAFATTQPSNAPLLDINPENETIGNNLDAVLIARNDERDVALPLLPDDLCSRYIKLHDNSHNNARNDENYPRYVNLQPGETTGRSTGSRIDENGPMLEDPTEPEPEEDSFL